MENSRKNVRSMMNKNMKINEELKIVKIINAHHAITAENTLIVNYESCRRIPLQIRRRI